MQTPLSSKVFSLLFLLNFLSGCATTGNHTENLPSSAKSAKKEGPARAPAVTEESQFNIPIVMNQDVEWFINYFQTANRKHFIRWLARSSRYIPLMTEILKEHDLPSDLVYLAMIESGFSTSARSYRHAVGPWQFIQGTAKRYGLQMDWWIDERQDPIRSTFAAAAYLKDLYGMFDSWFLAAAGYNAGENKIKRAIQRYNSEDFWELKNQRYFKRETKQYVPKMIAAALIAKNPGKYGFFDIEYHDPLEFEIVMVDAPVDLKEVARITGTTTEEIRLLNPELRRWCTPPNVENYSLKIPKGTQETFLARYEEIKPKEKMLFHSHQILRGDTLSEIAKRYRTNVQPIMEMNDLKSPNHLRPGRHLIIPVRAVTETNQST